MLRFYFLNVGQGSSTIVERVQDDEHYFGVIDSNCRKADEHVVLKKLHSLKADSLSFVMLTHPHADHYAGMIDILRSYAGNIGAFYVFDVGDLITNANRLNRLKENYKTLLDGTVDHNIRARIIELVQIIRWLTENQNIVTVCGGEFHQIAPEGFAGVAIHTVLPQRRAKGNWFQSIEAGDLKIHNSLKENALSIAALFEYEGERVLLGGDGVESNWSDRLRWVARGGTSASSRTINLPHHGSKYENTQEFLDGYFADSDNRIAVVSADGQRHPDPEVIEELERRSIHPYCTNLMPVCGANVQMLRNLPTLSPALAKLVRETAEPRLVPQTCQGSITLTIQENGQINIEPEIHAPCTFRGDYERLFH